MMQMELKDATSSTYVQGNTDGITTYYQHETGTDQVKGGTVTAITANILSGDFDITQRVARGRKLILCQILEVMVSL